jgi:glutamate synthase (NADPH/NADH) small chain
MGELGGFLRYGRKTPSRRPVPVRVRDWRECYEAFPLEEVRTQAARCMDCGIPFCHEGCPLGNLIPSWNDLVFRHEWREAIEQLHATNNFPEFTGRLCPAPCEGSCVLGINSEPVAIKQVELEIIERAFAEGWVTPRPPNQRTGKRVAVVGSGPAGLACAQQLTRAGHSVVVFERAERPGGLLRYGIPEFKMEKRFLDRRLEQMREEGTEFQVRTQVGGQLCEPMVSPNGSSPVPPRLPAWPSGATELVTAEELVSEFDAVVLACGSTVPRDLDIPGRELAGIHTAMTYLRPANLVREGALAEPPITAKGKRVVIIGGGDTGADCLGTAHRQGAVSVHQLEIMPEPPRQRSPDNPWPQWPVILRTSSAHEEGGERLYSVTASEFLEGEPGRVGAVRIHQVRTEVVDGRPSFVPVPGSERELPCELVLLAMGFVGPERDKVVADLGLELDGRGNVACSQSWETSVPGVFACGDMVRGQSLIVWAIAEGRSAAQAVDRYLMGTSLLPAPLVPGQAALR